MIADGGAEALLAKFGNTAEGRQRVRAQVTRTALAQAREQATLAGLSLACRDRTRRWGAEHTPCANPGGRTCLCVCHDPQPVPMGTAA